MRNVSRLRIGGNLFLLLVFLALVGPLLSPHDPLEVRLRAELLPPSSTHWLGTDADGADILTRLLVGARLSLSVGLLTVAVSSLVGTLLGTLAGYSGRHWDRLFMLLTDVLLGFPGMLIPLALTSIFQERGVLMIVLALGATGWVSFARLARIQALALRDADFVVAARACGIPTQRLLSRYMLPNMVSPLVVQASHAMAGAILAEAALSFLGLGMPPGTPSWGSMLDQGRHYLLIAPQLSLYPGLAIMLVVLSLNLLGDGLRDLLDPRGSTSIQEQR